MLNNASLRATGQRIAVLSALLKLQKPLTHEQIAEQLGEKAPDGVTIYRSLESLINADIVHRVYLAGRTGCFELAQNCTARQCHPHFTCRSCNRTHCLTMLKVPAVKSPHEGFVIQHQSTYLEGLCPACSGGAVAEADN